MEESSSSSESSTGNLTPDRGEDFARAKVIFSFAKHYSKLQIQINDLRNAFGILKSNCSNCEASVYKRLDDMEQNIAKNAEEIKYMRYYVTELSDNMESIQKEMSQLKISLNRQEQVEISPRNTSARPSP